MKMVELFLFLVFGVLHVSRGSLEGGLCTEHSSLSSQQVHPFFLREQPALGCLGPAPANLSFHVIRLEGPEDGEVYLELKGYSESRLVLVLDSPPKTTWRVYYTNLTIAKIITTTVSNIVHHLNGTLITDTIRIPQAGVSSVNPITTFTSVKQANRIILQIPQSYQTVKCDVYSREPSPVARAYLATPAIARGCLSNRKLSHGEVYIIDLKTNMTKQNSSVNEIEINFIPVPGGEPGTAERNLTVILRSDKEMSWTIHSQDTPILLVFNPGTDEFVWTGEQERLKVDKTDLPLDFSALMNTVTQRFGPPSFIQIYDANFLQIFSPPRIRRESNTARDLNTLSTSQSKEKEAIIGSVRDSLSKDCTLSKISVAVPADIIDGSGIEQITLNDPSCVAEANGTHYTVASHSTACGSTALTYGNAPLYRNNLVLHFTDDPTEVRIPYLCKFKPGIPGITRRLEDMVDEEYGDLEQLESSDEMYGIEVELLQPAGSSKLLRSKLDSAPVALHDDLYVQSHINAVRYLALAIEQCWLSSSPKAATHAGQSDLKLVLAGCPAHPAVEMHWDKTSANAAFSFQVSEDMSTLGKVWLQCRMGLCSATSAGAQGNILRCEDPSVLCRSNKPHRESSLQQVTVRGPLHILPVSRSILGQLKPPVDQVVHQVPAEREEAEEQQQEGEGTQRPPHGTLVGVTIEVAVAISLASFMVGACSTGVLWFIHSKALTAKAGNVVEGTELRTGLSSEETHCQASLNRSRDPNGNCSGCPLLR